MWLAHALTLLRIPIAIAVALEYGQTWPVVALIALAAATDVADGNVARYMQRRGCTKPAIGGWLDPLADKIFVAIVLVAIATHTRDIVLIALIGARELLLLPLVAIYLAVRRDRTKLEADAVGKKICDDRAIHRARGRGRPAPPRIARRDRRRGARHRVGRALRAGTTDAASIVMQHLIERMAKAHPAPESELGPDVVEHARVLFECAQVCEACAPMRVSPSTRSSRSSTASGSTSIAPTSVAPRHACCPVRLRPISA